MRYICLTLCLALAACGGGSESTAPSPSVAGTYQLVSIDGVVPPVRIADHEQYGRTLVTHATLFVWAAPTQNGPQEYARSYQDSVTVVFPDVHNSPGVKVWRDVGDVYLAGNRLALVSWISGYSEPAVVTTTDVTVLKDGRHWLYRK